MARLVDIVDYVNLGLFTALALAAVWLWRTRRNVQAGWAAATFGVLALVANAGRLVEPLDGLDGGAATRAVLALLVLFPYFLFRFAEAFDAEGRRARALVDAWTLFVVAFTVAQPTIPGEGEQATALFRVYVGVFVVHWAVLSMVAAARLWRAGGGQPSVARRRMRLLAAAATLLTLILFVAALEPESAALDLALGLLTSASALAFLVGLAPPPTLRLLWRRPEQARAQSATAALLEYGTEREIAERILPTLRDLVGAEAAGVFVSGALLAAEGDVEALDRPEVVRVEIPEGEIRVAASPYAPVFGDEELRLLRSLAVLTGVALDRARLVARERELLERADELKTQFVALAAHELRTPIAALTGFAETLEQRGDELPPEQRELIERTLYEEIRRTGRLVEQLLDLSRLDAAAVKLDPQPLEVRAKVEELVRAAAGPRADDVAVEIPPGLVASLDADALERVVGNLVTNALRYGAPPITVTATQNGGHLRLAVEDSGEGVPEEFVPRLFERFTRSADAPSASGGSGLGLAIARSYAQAHGGELVYERGARGARFELVVPVA